MDEAHAMEMKTLLVTGAAGSLGSELSLAAAARAFRMILLDCDRNGLERLYDRIEESGLPEPALQVIDLAEAGPDDVQEILAAIEAEFGRLDGLVHCAAHFDALTPLEHVPPQEWLLSMQVNLNAAWLLSTLCLPMLRKSGNGRMYFMLEDMAVVGGALWGPYGVSKHALRAMVGQMAAECQGAGIQVLGINPGPMRSPLRSRVYLAENPALPPQPTIAAQAIVNLLLGELEPSGVYVDLSALGAEA
jgi:NAD(P)-dependent dehydrogenase (short-subunit alcohol dehydrogenase family)